jgi:hypothetical protein
LLRRASGRLVVVMFGGGGAGGALTVIESVREAVSGGLCASATCAVKA